MLGLLLPKLPRQFAEETLTPCAGHGLSFVESSSQHASLNSHLHIHEPDINASTFIQIHSYVGFNTTTVEQVHINTNAKVESDVQQGALVRSVDLGYPAYGKCLLPVVLAPVLSLVLLAHGLAPFL